MLGYLWYRILSALFGILPGDLASRVGYSFGYVSSFVARKRFHTAEQHMRKVLGTDAAPKKIRKAARRALGFWGRYWAEVFWIRPQRLEKMLARIRVEGIENLQAAQSVHKGTVVISAHIGNLEFAGAWYAFQYGKPLLVVIEHTSNERVFKWTIKHRLEMKIEVAVAGTQSSMRRTLQHLNAGGTVVVVNDRVFPETETVSVPFFREEVEMPIGSVALGVQTDAKIVPVAVYFGPEGHRIVVHPPILVPDAPTKKERIISGTKQVASILEKMILRSPEQWHMFQPLWPSDSEEPPQK